MPDKSPPVHGAPKAAKSEEAHKGYAKKKEQPKDEKADLAAQVRAALQEGAQKQQGAPEQDFLDLTQPEQAPPAGGQGQWAGPPLDQRAIGPAPPVGAPPAAKPGEKEKPELIESKEQRIELLKKFTQEVLKRYGNVVRSIVLFGSTARGGFRGESDIDIFVILDDTRTRLTPAMRDQIEDDMVYIASGLSKLMSIQQPYTLTEFWRLVREGHPIVYNFIREGVPVYDRDVFLPIKRLLQMGEIRPSKEAVERFIERGPQRIKRVENAKSYMVVEDLYYAMLESAQAVLMFLGRTPPRPGEAPGELRKTVVEMKYLDPRFVKDLEDIIEVRKEVEHKRINDISGAEVDQWIKKADAFVQEMQKLIVKIEVLKRENMIEKSYGVMTET
ncbi:MAG TPA: nucleotidyltransferase domain-containing protein, partial [archaeon]|nr:nucleotidyltransferase domain-containing protein [archaeon]